MPGALVTQNSDAWREALERIGHDVYHTPAYAAIEARQGDGEPVAFVHRDGERVFLLPLVLRDIPGTPWRDAASGYGYPGPVGAPVWTGAEEDTDRFWDASLTALAHTLADADVVSCFVRLHPLLPAPLDVLRRHGVLVEHGLTVAVDVTTSHEAIWRGLRSNHRRQIRSATAAGLTLAIDRWPELDAFVDAYHDTMRHVGAAPSYFFDRAYFESLRTELDGATHLVTAHLAGQTVAGAVLFEHGGIVQYHLGATRDGHRDRQPMKAVLLRAMEWAHERGNRVVHLGGGLGARSDSLFHFKAGFSDLRFPFHTWRLVVDPGRYRTLSDAVGSPIEDPLFFPAYRRPG